MMPSWLRSRELRQTPAESPQHAAEVQERMRRDWDDRARLDARYYIATDAAESEERFSASGEQSVQTILGDIAHLLPQQGTVLEIGCGIGRMLRPLAGHFQTVWGVDVSPEMIERGRTRLSDLPNVEIWCTNGSDFAPIPSNSVDLAISYLVFQHIPDRSVAESNIREALRVLRPGGLFKFQVAGLPNDAAAAADRLRAKDTWNGVSFSDGEIRRVVTDAGFEVVSTYSHKPPDSCIFLWVVARKPRGGIIDRLTNGAGFFRRVFRRVPVSSNV